MEFTRRLIYRLEHLEINLKIANSFQIPLGDKDRLLKLPQLKSIDYTLVGLGWKESIADMILSSIGKFTILY